MNALRSKGWRAAVAVASLVVLVVALLRPAFAPAQGPTQAATQAPQPQVVSSSWRTVCSTEAAAKWRCQMEKTVPGPNRNGVLMQMLITRAAGEKGSQAQFVVPLAVYLPAGVEFTPEKGKPLKVAYTACSQQGCIAPFAMDDALAGQLKGGTKLDVRFVMRDQNPVNIAIDLKGFAEAFDKLAQK